MFFVPLQVDMRKVFTSLAVVLLGLWYLFSVIGFDVHTCTYIGKTFIATVASGFTCADIHPEQHEHHSCHKGCACGHHKHADDSQNGISGVKSCCSDDFQLILLTGTPVSENDDLSGLSAVQSLVQEDPMSCYNPSEISRSTVFYKPRSWIGSQRNLLASYSVWRI